MSPAALLAAAALAAGPPPASLDLGAVQLGYAVRRVVRMHVLRAAASGAGFSVARTRGGVVVVFEPYELGEEAEGTLAVRTPSRLVRIALRGRGIDTLRPRVTVETPRAAFAGRALTLRFTAVDNDLVRSCTLSVGGRVVGRVGGPASAFRWRVPAGIGRHARVGVVAVDRAGNRASAVSRSFAIR
jgi:hypothetical protein